MAELKEIFEMVTNETEPDLRAWTEQERRQRRASRNRKYVAIAVVAAIVVALVVFAAAADQNETTKPAQPTPSPVSGFSHIYESRGTIFFVGEGGSPVALTHGYSPNLSPDGTTIAFLRDPADQHYGGHGDPFVLQVWLMQPDGSDLRQLGEQHGCCVGASAELSWSPDGSSIILNAIRDQTWDVATGESLPMPSPTE
jgi:WD40-like Beta Propeller Repeat